MARTSVVFTIVFTPDKPLSTLITSARNWPPTASRCGHLPGTWKPNTLTHPVHSCAGSPTFLWPDPAAPIRREHDFYLERVWVCVEEDLYLLLCKHGRGTAIEVTLIGAMTQEGRSKWFILRAAGYEVTTASPPWPASIPRWCITSSNASFSTLVNQVWASGAHQPDLQLRNK